MNSAEFPKRSEGIWLKSITWAETRAVLGLRLANDDEPPASLPCPVEPAQGSLFGDHKR